MAHATQASRATPQGIADVVAALIRDFGDRAKVSEAIRKNVDGLSDEIRKGEKALDLLLRKAHSTLRAMNVELIDEAAERESPVLLPNDSFLQVAVILPADQGTA